jgi:hypothetical protein
VWKDQQRSKQRKRRAFLGGRSEDEAELLKGIKVPEAEKTLLQALRRPF